MRAISFSFSSLLLFFIFTKPLFAQSADEVDPEDAKSCLSSPKELQKDDLYLKSKSVKSLGSLDGVHIDWISVTLTDVKPGDDDNSESTTQCFFATLKKNSHQEVQTFFAGDTPPVPGYAHALLDMSGEIKGQKFITHRSLEGRGEEEGAEMLVYYQLDSKNLRLIKLKEGYQSDTDTEQEEVEKLLRKGNVDGALLAIDKMERVPDGLSDRTVDFFEMYADEVFAQFRKWISSGQSKRVGITAQKFLDSLDSQNKKPHYFSSLQVTPKPSDALIRKFNDLAFFMDLQEKPGANPEEIYHWILEKRPLRAVTQLNLGDHYEKVGQHEKALSAYAAYKKACEASNPPTEPKLKPAILKELRTWKDPSK